MLVRRSLVCGLGFRVLFRENYIGSAGFVVLDHGAIRTRIQFRTGRIRPSQQICSKLLETVKPTAHTQTLTV